MNAANESHSFHDLREPCRGNCSGYGSRCCCPPLVVLAMRSMPAEALPEGETASYGEALVSSEFSSCAFAYHAQTSGLKMEM